MIAFLQKAKRVQALQVALIFFLIFIAGFFFLNKNIEKSAKLKVLTYSSFVSDWGAGPILEKEFEKQCQCDLQFISVGSAGLLLTSFKVYKNIDAIMGLTNVDQISTQNQNEFMDLSLLFKKINFVEAINKIYKTKADKHYPAIFLPYDWAPLSFLYDSQNFNQVLQEENLIDMSKKTLGVDFKRSSLGPSLKKWLHYKKQIGQELLIGRIFPSWSQMYGFFTQSPKGFLIFSYLTSLVYHWERGELQYKFVPLQRHPYQMEFLAISKNTKQKNLALSFANFILSVRAQKVLMRKNYMLPVSPEAIKGTLFEKIPQVELLSQ